MESLKVAPKVAPPPPKITRAQIEKMKEKTIKAEPVKPVVSYSISNYLIYQRLIKSKQLTNLKSINILINQSNQPIY